MRLACVQSDVAFDEPMVNANRAIDHLRSLKAKGVELAVFPEAYLTGYCVDSQSAADAIAIPTGSAPHEALSAIQNACEALDILAVVGFAESAQGGVYNGAALFEPGTPIRYYRKSHLPHLGLDRFVSSGNDLPIFETRLGKIGILICFDLRPPEATRSLALRGADVIVLPTNWPEGAETSADHIAIARAAENRVFVATCNRVGVENGFRFIGRSKIVHPSGRVLASAGDGEEVIVADLELADARNKRTTNIPDKYETEVFLSRRPELYGALTDLV